MINKRVHGVSPGSLMKEFGTGLFHADDAVHAQLRRILGPAFSVKAVRDMSPTLMKYADLLVGQLRKAISRDPVQDMSMWLNYATFDLTGEVTFGETFGCLEHGKNGQGRLLLENVLSGVIKGSKMSPVLRYIDVNRLLPLLPKSRLEEVMKLGKYTIYAVTRRVEKGYMKGHTDVINILLQSEDPEDQLPLSELYQNALILIVAGSETTATLLTAVTYLLCKHPAIMQRLKDEVREAFMEDSDITTAAVNELPYMIAVLKEAMRFFPPVPLGFPRIITAPKGQLVCGHRVPGGVSL